MATRNIAVVLGVDAYTPPIAQLSTAVADAQAIATLLKRRHGYSVLYLANEHANKDRLKRLFTWLGKALTQEDRLLFYFAGHGIALQSENDPRGYLLLSDAVADREDSFLSKKSLYSWLSVCRCRQLLTVLDCCFAGAFEWRHTRHFAIAAPILYQERYERYIEDPAWQLLTSSSREALDVVLGNTLGKRERRRAHSPFALALMKGLRGAADRIYSDRGRATLGDGVITATDLYLYIRNTIEHAPFRQI